MILNKANFFHVIHCKKLCALCMDEAVTERILKL